MTNINKILITVVVCVFMLCVAAVSIVKIVSADKPEITEPVSLSDEQTTLTPETASQTSADTASTLPTGTTSSTSAYTAPGTTVAVEELKTAILGKWSDSLGMMGYEFFEDGMVNVTVFDLKQLVGLDLEGTQKLPYTLEGDIVTIKFSAYTGTAQWKFRVSVEGNELTMYNLEEHETSVYTRVVV